MAVTEGDAAGAVAVAVAVAAPGGIATGEKVGALVEAERVGGSGSGRVEVRGGSGREGAVGCDVMTRTMLLAMPMMATGVQKKRILAP